MDTNELALVKETEARFNTPLTDAEQARIDKQAEARQSRFLRHVIVPIILIVIGSILGTTGTLVVVQHEQAKEIPPCSVYKYTRTPVLPENVRTDACITIEGDGSTSLYTGDGMWKAGY